MRRILLGPLLFATLNAFGQMLSPTPSEIQATLRKEFTDKVVTLRAFYPEEQVRFTFDGRYQGYKKQDTWTLWSKIKIRTIEVSPVALTIKGQRVHVAYDDKQRIVNVDSKEKAAITVDFGTTPMTPASVKTAMENVFLTKEQHLSAFVPIEWHGFLKSDESGQAQSQILAEIEKGPPEALKVSSGNITPPRAISAPDPSYGREARKAKVHGTVMVWAVVDEQGRVPAIRIVRPLGMGLDERAVDAIRGWRFEPAKKDGVPVKVQVNIEVHFELW
jgi:TonB family protein